MNDNIKVSLTIELEGSTLVRKSKPDIITYSITKKDLSPNKKWKDKEQFKIVEKGKIPHYSYTTKSASQHINLNEDAYNYMISDERPAFAKSKFWKALSKKQRLEVHLQRLCEYFGGTSYSYKLLNE